MERDVVVPLQPKFYRSFLDDISWAQQIAIENEVFAPAKGGGIKVFPAYGGGEARFFTIFVHSFRYLSQTSLKKLLRPYIKYFKPF